MWPTFFLPSLLRAGVTDRPPQFAAVRCGETEAPIDMAVDFPAARAGQCIFFIVYTQYNTSYSDADALIEHATDILPLALKGNSALNSPTHYVPNVYYKFLEEADLTRIFTFSVDGYLVGPVCAAAFVIDSVNTACPVMTPTTWWSEYRASHTLCGPVELPDTDAYVFQVIGWLPADPLETATPFDLGVVKGPQDVTLSFDHQFGMDGTSASEPAKQYWLGVWKALLAQDENWIPGETALNSLDTANGWTATGMTRTRPGTYYTLIAATGTGRHQMERDVTLAAGEEYTFAVMITSPTNGNSAPYISILDPNANEAGLGVWKVSPDYSSFPPSFIIDTAADRGTQWHDGHFLPHIDGDPNYAGGWLFIHFKARVAGTHTLRIGTTNGTSSLSYTSTGAAEEKVQIRHALFRRGFVNPMKVYTPSGAVTDGTGAEMKRAATFNARGFRQGNAYSYAWSIVPAGVPVPPMRIATGADTDIDGMEIYPLTAILDYSYGGNHYGQHHLSRPLFPMANGSPGKYYLECKLTAVAASTGVTVGVSPMWYGITNSAPIAGVLPAGAPRYSYTYTPTLNDVIGITVDFDAKQVKFYVNNTLQSTVSMVDNYQTGGNDEANMPMVVQCSRLHNSRIYGRHILEWKVKTADFTYSPPTGFIEADYLS